MKKLPPFEWAGRGWGYFTISIIIALEPGYSWAFPGARMDPGGRSLLPLHWSLNFKQEFTYHDFEVGLAALETELNS